MLRRACLQILSLPSVNNRSKEQGISVHYLGNNFVLMVREAHKQGLLIDSPLHEKIAAALDQQMHSPSGFGNRISLTLVEEVFDALTKRDAIPALREQLKMTGLGANFTVRALYILTAPTFTHCARNSMALANIDNNVFTANIVEKSDVTEINVHFHVETTQPIKEHILSVVDQFSDFLRRVRKNNQDSSKDPTGSAINDEEHPLASVLAPEVFKKLPFSFVFDRTVLEQANPFSNPADYRLLGETLRNDTNRADEPLQYTRLVMAQVAQAFENKAACNLKDIATLNRVSEATLKRKLSNEGSSFVAIKAKLRADQALLLLEQAVTQDSISDYLQYACPTGFSRSFKAWYGVNPTKIAERFHAEHASQAQRIRNSSSA